MELKEGDLVLCTVKKIEKTTIFVIMEEGGEGAIVVSEIAPGRIRNLRDYVIPGKKIVCKILSMDKSGNIHLSLRRVSGKERQEVLDKYERERNALSIIKSVVKEKVLDIADKIKHASSLYDFLQSCKESAEKLTEYFTKEEAEKICKILQERKERKVEVKKEFSLKSNLSNGIIKIKNILLPDKNSISYIAAGRFIIKIKAEDYKKANQECQKILQEIEDKARKEKLEFEIKGK